MSGKLDKAKGQVKETVGKAVGNKRLEREGRRDRVVGEVKDRISRLKQRVADKIVERSHS
jgi:uncharacterized protein YjbJ (UPF0337 family)